MELSKGSNLVIERNHAKITVVRFTRPDIRTALDGAGVEDYPLYQEMAPAVLNRIGDGESLILNFGLIHYFPTAFYQFLLTLRDELTEKKTRMILCCFTPEVLEGMRLFHGERVFEITGTEEQALRRAKDPNTPKK